jgi:hypothetical protein
MTVRQIHAQVEIPNTSGLPEDSAVNNFSFTVDDAVWTRVDAATQLSSIIANDFYGSIASMMNALAKLSLLKIKWYDRGDAAPRLPFYTATGLGLSDAAGSPLPNEVALVLSFHAAFESGHPPARYRGRVYMPFIDASEVNQRHGSGAPSSTLTGALKTAGQTLLSSTVGYTGIRWGVRSDMDDVTRPVVGGWVDDEFDTQRRRGTRPLSRFLWP